MEEAHYKMYAKLLQVNNFITAKMHKLFKEKEVTRSQFNVLRTLGDIYPETCNARYIKDHMVVNAPDVTRLLDRLILKGYITRKRNEEKRRQIEVRITEKGIDVIEAVGPEAHNAIDFLEQLSVKEANNVNKALDKLLYV